MSRDPEGVRERILDAGVRLLREAGIRALSGAQVAKSAGLSQSHLTYYFPRRTDLLVAVGRHSLGTVLAQLRGFFGASEMPLQDQTVRDRVLMLLRPLLEDRARTRMMLGLLVESEDDPALRTVLRENSGFLRGAAALALGRATDHADVDIVLATLWGLGIQQLFYEDSEVGRARTERVLRRLGDWIDAAPAAEVTPVTPKAP
ncbi:MAG: TetR family transcriptional regulator [Polyangiales bacterium]